MGPAPPARAGARRIEVDEHGAQPAQAAGLGEVDELGEAAPRPAGGRRAVEDQPLVGVDGEVPAVIAHARDQRVDPALLAGERPVGGVERDVGRGGEQCPRRVPRAVVDDSEAGDPEPAVVGEEARQPRRLVAHHRDQRRGSRVVRPGRARHRPEPGLRRLLDHRPHVGRQVAGRRRHHRPERRVLDACRAPPHRATVAEARLGRKPGRATVSDVEQGPAAARARATGTPARPWRSPAEAPADYRP